MKKWLGIDFSGNYKKWEPDCEGSNVWIATLVEGEGQRELKNLIPVQELDGEPKEKPFERLVNFLRQKDFAAAGIDAPFSIPKKFMKKMSHNDLLLKVAGIADKERSPFPEGKTFVNKIAGQIEKNKPPEDFRITD